MDQGLFCSNSLMLETLLSREMLFSNPNVFYLARKREDVVIYDDSDDHNGSIIIQPPNFVLQADLQSEIHCECWGY